MSCVNEIGWDDAHIAVQTDNSLSVSSTQSLGLQLSEEQTACISLGIAGVLFIDSCPNVVRLNRIGISYRTGFREDF